MMHGKMMRGCRTGRMRCWRAAWHRAVQNYRRLTLMKPPHSLLYKPPLDGRLIHDELQGTTLLQLTGKLA